ncbi:hypothetical protein Tco_0313141 [Tanacetum coccineum]
MSMRPLRRRHRSPLREVAREDDSLPTSPPPSLLSHTHPPLHPINTSLPSTIPSPPEMPRFGLPLRKRPERRTTPCSWIRGRGRVRQLARLSRAAGHSRWNACNQTRSRHITRTKTYGHGSASEITELQGCRPRNTSQLRSAKKQDYRKTKTVSETLKNSERASDSDDRAQNSRDLLRSCRARATRDASSILNWNL